MDRTPLRKEVVTVRFATVENRRPTKALIIYILAKSVIRESGVTSFLLMPAVLTVHRGKPLIQTNRRASLVSQESTPQKVTMNARNALPALINIA